MNLVICCVYDAAVGQYLTPFFQRSKMEALRSFSTFANQEGHDFQRYAADYTLFAIGEFNPDDGTMEQYQAPERLAVAIELIQQVPDVAQAELPLVAEEKSAH